MSEVNKPAKTLVGQVVSDKMAKTIVVLVERKIRHPKYNKYIKRTFKVHAHDEAQQAKIGDYVKCKAVRPYSRTKFWELVEVFAS